MKRIDNPQCRCCCSPHRASIELGLANKVPVRTLARRWDVSKESCYRHRKNHMPAQLMAQLLIGERQTEVDLDKLRITESEGLLQHLVAQRGRLYKLVDDAETLGDILAAVRVHGQLRGNLELTGKLLGDLRVGSVNITQNLLISEDYHRLRTHLVQALRPYPQARQAVAAVLQQVEREQAPAIEHAP